MDFSYRLLIVAHLLGMAAITGPWFANLPRATVVRTQLWGARAQLLTGLLLVGFLESGLVDPDEPVNHLKVGVKLIIALAVTGIAEVRFRRGASKIAHLVGGLALVNILIAVFWQ